MADTVEKEAGSNSLPGDGDLFEIHKMTPDKLSDYIFECGVVLIVLFAMALFIYRCFKDD